MGKNTVMLLFIFLISTSSLISTSAFSSSSDSLIFKKQTEIQQIKPKKPVKIKLKRLATGNYSWDLTGDDLQEIIRIDKKLRKQLKLE